MKKVLFTSILLLSAVSFGGNIYAQDATGGNGTEVTTPSATQPSVKFKAPSATQTSVKFTADGNTLTISGQGDLTSYTTTDWSAKVFTDNAVGFVFTDADGKTPVAAGDSYNAGKTYYHAKYDYTEVWKGQPVAWNDYFGTVTAKRSWKDNKKANLYMATIDTYNKNVTVGDKVSDNVNWDQEILADWNHTTIDGKKYVKVVEVTGEVPTSPVSFDNLQASGIKLIEVSELQSDFINTKVTYQIKDKLSLFLSSDGGKTYKGLTSGVDYEWTSDDVFWQGTATYTAIEDNNAFFDEHTDYVQADNTEISFKELLRRKILEGVSVYDYNAKKEVGVSSYTTVKFVNNGSDPLLIDADVVREILYPTSNGMLTTNVTTTKLDLGEATLNELNADIFIPSQDESYKCHKLALNDITFPKTKLTSVYSESTKQDENKMVLPAQLLSNITRYIKTLSIPEGYDRIADGAFSNENKQSVLENVNLPKGLTLIGKNAFQNCTYIKSIELNEGLENIGDSAFFGTTLGTVKFPSSLKIINDCAFANCHIYNLKFNAGLKYIGNSAFALSNAHTEQVLEIPASVIYIGPYAFNFRQYQDVYFYGEKAPLMPLGSYKLDINTKDLGTAFPQHTLNGNNGFDPLPKEGEEITGDDTKSGYANRENYKNHGVYLCMLHYPKELSDENRDTYTDITRVYKTYRTADGGFIATDTGTDEATDKVGKEGADEKLSAGYCHSYVKVTWGYADTYLGEQYIWPSHSQFNRAYCTASHSVKWDGVTPVTCDLSAEEIAALKYAGYDTSEQNLDELKKIAHMGTRQFVLANADAFVDDKPEEEPEYPVDVKGGKWWTLCLPFNMTKAMVDETFGKDTQVCLFDRVVRQVNETTRKNRIVLYFTQNVYKHKTEPKKADGTWNFQPAAQAPADKDTVIYAHESYMIYPTKTGEDAVFAVKNYQPAVGSPTPTVVIGKNEYIGASSAPDNVPYRYVGNYLESVDAQTASQSVDAQALQEVKIPKYSYVYASNGKETKFWFLTSDKMTWKPNKCVVQTNTRGDGERDHEEFFGYNATGAKQASFFGEDFIDTPTSIEDEMVIIAGEGSDAPVYSLDGTLVNSTGDLTGLPKGVYIKGGKKYVVK